MHRCWCPGINLLTIQVHPLWSCPGSSLGVSLDLAVEASRDLKLPSQFSSVQSLGRSNSLRPHELQHARLPVHHQLLELTQTRVRRVGDAIQPAHPLSSPSPLPSIFPSISVFSNELALPVR